MKKVVGCFAVVYGVGLSIYFGSWALRDNAALEVAVKADIPSRELRHRINVFSEGVWFLMSNMIGEKTLLIPICAFISFPKSPRFLSTLPTMV